MFCTRHSNSIQDAKEARLAKEELYQDIQDLSHQKPAWTDNLCAQCALFMMRAILGALQDASFGRWAVLAHKKWHKLAIK